MCVNERLMFTFTKHLFATLQRVDHNATLWHGQRGKERAYDICPLCCRWIIAKLHLQVISQAVSEALCVWVCGGLRIRNDPSLVKGKGKQGSIFNSSSFQGNIVPRDVFSSHSLKFQETMDRATYSCLNTFRWEFRQMNEMEKKKKNCQTAFSLRRSTLTAPTVVAYILYAFFRLCCTLVYILILGISS